MNKKYLVLIPTSIRFSITEISMSECSEAMAFDLGTAAVKKENNVLESFELDLVGAVGGEKNRIATHLMKIANVYQGQEKEKASEWARSMMATGNF